jgi:hypothetical protein
MLPAHGVEQDVLDIGEGGNEEPWTIVRGTIEGCRVKAQRSSSGLGQPDRVTLCSRQLWINESRLVPGPRRLRGGRASG